MNKDEPMGNKLDYYNYVIFRDGIDRNPGYVNRCFGKMTDDLVIWKI